MLVKFRSNVCGEMIMFAEIAHTLLAAMGKECTARGVFVREEMLAAADRLRQAVSGATPNTEDEEKEPKDRPVALAQRAWPLIDMLERTARGDAKAHILWEAERDF